jgi:hypothetical protein
VEAAVPAKAGIHEHRKVESGQRSLAAVASIGVHESLLSPG